MNKIINPQPLLGSYKAEDCQFLLQEIEPEFSTVENKEYLIQSGQMHYSEMVHKEEAPTEQYKKLFHQMMVKYSGRLAMEVMRLADIIRKEKSEVISKGLPVVLLSLARAGTPVGVLLKRALKLLGVDSVHYSISIIRDKGIDEVALNAVVENYNEAGICFIDGWTAKGVITKELHASIEKYNETKGVIVPKELYVISDIGGTADFTATYDDYTIPSALMNSTVSGLTSRSILNKQTEGGYHGCVVYSHLKEEDVSNWFVDEISNLFDVNAMSPLITESKTERQNKTKAYLAATCEKYGVCDINRIKPGIAEATRVMLRRVPDILIVRAINDDVEHLIQIAKEKVIEVVVDSNMPFGACSLIKDVINK